jgi:Baseplate J-like protein
MSDKTPTKVTSIVSANKLPACTIAMDDLPGNNTLHYRIGTYSDFLTRQQQDLLTASPNDITQSPPWKTFDIVEPGNPIKALMEGWSMVLDILTFYQERILNEGYLQTAQQPRSVMELGTQTGYVFSKGLGATTFLTFTAAKPTDETAAISIPCYTAAKAITPPATQPSSSGPIIFETSSAFTAYYDWNAIAVQQMGLALATRTDTDSPQAGDTASTQTTASSSSSMQDSSLPRSTDDITPTTLPYYKDQIIDNNSVSIILQGSALQLSAGDRLLLVSKKNAEQNAEQPLWYGIALIANVTVDNKQNNSCVSWTSPLQTFNTTQDDSDPLPVQASDVEAYRFGQQANIYGYKALEWKKLSDKKKLSFRPSSVYCYRGSLDDAKTATPWSTQYQISRSVYAIVQYSLSDTTTHTVTTDYFVATRGSGIVRATRESASDNDVNTGVNNSAKAELNWWPCNNGLTSLNINALQALPDPLNNNAPRLLAGSADQGVFLSKNNLSQKNADRWAPANGSIQTDISTGAVTLRTLPSPIINCLATSAAIESAGEEVAVLAGTASGIFMAAGASSASAALFNSAVNRDTSDDTATVEALEAQLSGLFTVNKIPTTGLATATVKISVTDFGSDQWKAQSLDFDHGFILATTPIMQNGDYTVTVTPKTLLFDLSVDFTPSDSAKIDSTSSVKPWQLNYAGLDSNNVKSSLESPFLTITIPHDYQASIADNTQLLSVTGTDIASVVIDQLTFTAHGALPVGDYHIRLNTGIDKMSLFITHFYPQCTFWDPVALVKDDKNVTTLDIQVNADSTNLTIYAGTSTGNIYTGTVNINTPAVVNNIKTFTQQNNEAYTVTAIVSLNDRVYVAYKGAGIYQIDPNSSDNRNGIWPTKNITQNVLCLTAVTWHGKATLFAGTDEGVYYNQHLTTSQALTSQAPGSEPETIEQYWQLLGADNQTLFKQDVRVINTSTISEEIWIGCMPNEYPDYFIQGNTLFLDRIYQNIIPNSTPAGNRSWVLLSQASQQPAFALKSILSTESVYHQAYGINGQRVTQLTVDSSNGLPQFNLRETIVWASSDELPVVTQLPQTQQHKTEQQTDKAKTQSSAATSSIDATVTPLSQIQPATLADKLSHKAGAAKLSIQHINTQLDTLTADNAQSLLPTLSSTSAKSEQLLSQIKASLATQADDHSQLQQLLDNAITDVHTLTPTLNNLRATYCNADSLSVEEKYDWPVGKILCLTGKLSDDDKQWVSELAQVKALDYRPDYTTITLTAPLQNAFVLSDLTVNANVVAASQGQSIMNEILGSGDSSLVNQQFKLKHGPLTYLDRTKNTLDVRVNSTLWTEKTTLIGSSSVGRYYRLVIDDERNTWVCFGDGINGARLETGSNNVVANYRYGMGENGNVAANTIKQLISPPRSIKKVTNTEAAQGGEDPQPPETAKTDIVHSNRYYQRIVSAEDYRLFCLTFPGIAKAIVDELWNELAYTTYISIAREPAKPDDATLENQNSGLSNNELLHNAVAERRQTGNPYQLLGYDTRYFSVNVNLQVSEDVDDINTLEKNLKQQLDTTFSFSNRDLAQNVNQSEVIAVLQNNDEVLSVKFNYFYIDSGEQVIERNVATLPARRARWNWNTHRVELAQLWLIDTQKSTLSFSTH